MDATSLSEGVVGLNLMLLRCLRVPLVKVDASSLCLKLPLVKVDATLLCLCC